MPDDTEKTGLSQIHEKINDTRELLIRIDERTKSLPDLDDIHDAIRDHQSDCPAVVKVGKLASIPPAPNAGFDKKFLLMVFGIIGSLSAAIVALVKIFMAHPPH
ncbi:MAG: hypothetical protein GWN96_06500 [candidate division Zixibacteria bacterium]|nr:hypothetical protein [candidate division Zixibacteria bacterium]